MAQWLVQACIVIVYPEGVDLNPTNISCIFVIKLIWVNSGT